MSKFKFFHYNDIDAYITAVLDVLLENEALNNLLIGILLDGNKDDCSSWLMSTVNDEHGAVILIALCTKPFDLLLYEPACGYGDKAVEFLAGELKRIDFLPPGVLALSGHAQSFSDAFCGSSGSKLQMSMILMRLDKLVKYNKAPGYCRMLTEDDLVFTPAWEQAFCVDCHLPEFTLSENRARIRTRLDKNTHFIWEDNQPVAQAVFGRETPNGAVINWVYTPPIFRGRGYATSVVAELSESLFKRGKSFCCLFADADNPTSRGVYRRLGYYDICRFDQIKIDTK